MNVTAIHLPAPRRAGNVLVLTLVLVLVMASMALLMARSIRVENTASANATADVRARQIAFGAGRAVLALGDALPGDAVEVAGGSFWMLLPVYGGDDPSVYHWGLIDESGKLNINSATTDMLMKLPGMTAEIAAAIVDWRDTDEEPTDSGAEDEYYRMLPVAYRAKNRPFETVDELLLVRGVTPELLDGEDMNRNGVLDTNEDDGDASPPSDNHDGRLDPGWIELVTVVGGLVPTEGLVNLNDGGTRESDIRRALEPVVGEQRAGELAATINAGKPYQNLIDLMIKTRMQADDFAQIEPLFVTGNERPHRINVNTAPPQVLLTLPELTENDVDRLADYRTANTTEESGLGVLQGYGSGAAASTGSAAGAGTATSTDPLASIAWVRQALGDEKAVAIGAAITTRSDQFSADVVAVAPGGRGFERYRWTYDRGGDTPGIVTMQRLTPLGWPLDPQILQDLRAGAAVGDLAESLDRGDF